MFRACKKVLLLILSLCSSLVGEERGLMITIEQITIYYKVLTANTVSFNVQIVSKFPLLR